MDNTTNQENMQESNSQLTPEEAKASLGLATRLSEEMLIEQNPQMEEEAPAEEVPQEEGPDMEEQMASMREQIRAEVMEEMEEMMQKRIEELKADIDDAIEEDGE